MRVGGRKNPSLHSAFLSFHSITALSLTLSSQPSGVIVNQNTHFLILNSLQSGFRSCTYLMSLQHVTLFIPHLLEIFPVELIISFSSNHPLTVFVPLLILYHSFIFPFYPRAYQIDIFSQILEVTKKKPTKTKLVFS